MLRLYFRSITQSTTRPVAFLHPCLVMDDGLYLNKYRVASTRWAGHNYRQSGSYFITICTKERQPYFGEIIPAADALQDASLLGNALSSRAYECWLQISQHFFFAEPGPFIVMPDHVHGILTFHSGAHQDDQSLPAFGPQSNNLASVVRGFKVGVKAWSTRVGLEFAWQARYFDRVIRNAQELEKISQYIQDNPNRWAADQCNDAGLFR